jgi:multiple sugar transport system ATP-binding protein
MTLADRIVVLSAGKIEQVGSPLDLYEHPDNIFVAGFIGSPRMNFIAAEIVESSAAQATVKLSTGAVIRCEVDALATKPGDKVTLGIRPEHLLKSEPENSIDTIVTFVESLGSTTHAYCAYPGVEEALTCGLDGRMRLHDGDRLTLSLPAVSCYLFDAKGRAFRRHTVADEQRAA